jgi:hypothetical protein
VTVENLVVRIGTLMRDRFDRISDAMTELIVDNETPLASDELARMLASSVSGNLETVIQLMCNRIPVEEARPSTVAIRYAQQLAERGISADQLRRAYHLGAEGGRREIFEIVRNLDCSADEKLKALHYIDGFLHSYIDWMSTEVLTAYEQEARRLTDYSATATARMIRDVLAGAQVPTERFESVARYRIDQQHRAAVIWVNQESAAVDHTTDLLSQVQRISRRPGFTGSTLFTAVDRGTAWVWFGVEDADPVAGLTELAEELRSRLPQAQICFGAAQSGISGFCGSHRQAQAAERVAHIAGPAHLTPVSYDDPGVALASLLSADMPALRQWVTEQLGGLAAQTEGAARLRETYAVFLDSGASYTRTGELMMLHRNSVKYRIVQARALMDVGGRETPAEASVALHMCRLFGESVLNVDPREE